MNKTATSVTAPQARVQELLALYSAPTACVAELLCDRRDPDSGAFRIIGQDLGVQMLRYGALREESERFACVLDGLGVRAGDRVATLMAHGRRWTLPSARHHERRCADHPHLYLRDHRAAQGRRRCGLPLRPVQRNSNCAALRAPGLSLPC
jgi:acetyl-CoA synthetase